MNYSQMSYAKLYQMESWPTEMLLFPITEFQMKEPKVGTKNIRIIADLSVKNITTQWVWITAEHLSILPPCETIYIEGNVHSVHNVQPP